MLGLNNKQWEVALTGAILAAAAFNIATFNFGSYSVSAANALEMPAPKRAVPSTRPAKA